jgi:hypothetical protein
MRPGKLTKAASTVHYAATTPAMAAALHRKAKKPRIGLYVGLGVGVAVAVAAVIFAPKLLDKYNQHKEVVAAEQAATNAPPPPPPELEADEILQKLDATYKAFTSYSAQGISVGTVDMSQVNPKLTQPQTVTTKLSLRLGRPDHYRMEWERDAGTQHVRQSEGPGDGLEYGRKLFRHARIAHCGCIFWRDKQPDDHAQELYEVAQRNS